MAVSQMRQDAFDHGRIFDAGNHPIGPLQVSQVSMSILNTRFRRSAYVVAALRFLGGSSALPA